MTSYSTGRKAWWRDLLIVSGLASISWMGFSVPAVALTDSPPSGFCRADMVVHDFLRPLANLPKSREVPESGRLPFGPKALRLFPPRTALVVVGHERFNLFGSLAHKSRSKSTELQWSAISRLQRINKHGRTLKQVKEKEQHVAKVSGFSRRDFGFGGVVEPGLYRLDVSFENNAGKVLGTYQEHFRAVNARSQLELGINSQTFYPGDTGLLRLKNYGTVDTTYSYKYQMWSVHEGSRTKIPLEPTAVSNDLPLARPGMAGHCFSFRVPESFRSGAYEIGVRVANPVLMRPKVTLAEFSVVRGS